MKKLLLSIAFILVASITMAQTNAYMPTEQRYTSANLNAVTTDTCIAIKNLSETNHYWYFGNTGAAPYSKATFANEAVFIWSPVESGVAGAYYLKKLDGTYMQASAPKDFGDKATAAVFTTTNPTSQGSGATHFNGDNATSEYIDGNDDANLVRFVKGDNWINVQNGDNGTPTYNQGTGGWTIHYVYGVELVQTVNVKYNYVYNNNTVDTESFVCKIGGEMPDITKVFPYGIVANKPAGNVSDQDAEYTITLTDSLPFEYAASYSEITKWYNMSIRDDAPTYLVYDQNVAYIPAVATEVPEEGKDNYAWAFIGDPFSGFEIVNKAAGETMVLSAPATPNANINAEQLARMVVKADVTGNTKWNFLTPTHAGVIAENGFYIKHPDNSYAFNRQDYNGGKVVCYWTSRDTGSTLQVTEIESEEPEIPTDPEPENPEPENPEPENPEPENPEPENPTAVEAVEVEAVKVIYDLTGRKVENITKAGVYIVNGCKVLVK